LTVRCRSDRLDCHELIGHRSAEVMQFKLGDSRAIAQPGQVDPIGLRSTSRNLHSARACWT
jgi:hypothetical protein